MSRLHYVLGYGGLVGFIGLTALIWLDWSTASGWMLSYSALIVSFLGGMLWQQSLISQTQQHVPVVAIILMLWPWLAIMLFPERWLILAAITLLLIWRYERRFLSEHYPAEFMQMRGILSISAAILLTLSFAGQLI